MLLVAFDTDVLSVLLQDGERADDSSRRLDFLVSELQKQKAKIIIPAPALAEFLVVADQAGPDYLAKIDRAAAFKVESFDGKAAAEAAAATRQALHKGNKRGHATGTWQCVKTDRQIVAICKTLGVVRIYSNDSDMRAIAEDMGLEAISVADLPLPPDNAPLLAIIENAQGDDATAVETAATEAESTEAGLQDASEASPPELSAPSPEASSSAPEQPAERSPDDAMPSVDEPAPVPPEAPHDAQAPQPQGFSVSVPPHPPSTE